MINGIIILDKPEGISSAKVIDKIKKSLGLIKAGHTGTLDPFATGLMVICLNRATKIAQYLSNLDKIYTGTMILGISTNTQDLEGSVKRIRTVGQRKIQTDEINRVFQKYRGEIWQTPPMYSALKYKGAKLYKLARKGITVDLKPRKITIYYLNLIRIKNDLYPSIFFEARCSKGTYIRTLCKDIGETLGYGAFLANLRRIGIGEFSISKSISMDHFLGLTYEEKLEKIIPVDQALGHLNKIVLHDPRSSLSQMRVGLAIDEKQIKETIIKDKLLMNEIFTVNSCEGQLIAIAKKSEFSLNNTTTYVVERILI
ncbi:MAG: tRNA pseudouridine(55) synthase TruB [Candidatus Atribacteria bacterium]|nr:tRNA pseudouridine(55) synthase TruB [Candidatus Atribacteria bacterium]